MLLGTLSEEESRWISAAKGLEIRTIYLKPDGKRQKRVSFPSRKVDEVRVDIVDYDPDVELCVAKSW